MDLSPPWRFVMQPMPEPKEKLSKPSTVAAAGILDGLEAVLVDLDGVVTDTAKVHALAWKSMFDEYLLERAARLDATFVPFDLEHDYRKYIDGKPRYDGVASFLESRNICLPPGREDDPPCKETVAALGNRKNEHFLAEIRRRGVDVYRSSVSFIRSIKSRGLKVAVVSSSRNCSEVLLSAGIGDLFDAQVDGIVARDWMLDGKPAPDAYLEAARRLGVEPSRAAVIEDAEAGVAAGKAGHFGLVIGVSRDGQPEALERMGADLVVADLSELPLADDDPRAGGIPSALAQLAAVQARLRGRRPAIFLDYDGTLTPIVDRPETAVLSEAMRSVLRALAARCTVAVLSGRALGDVQRLVDVDTITYAGAHGFDVAGPAQTGVRRRWGADYVPRLAQAARELRQRLASFAGVLVENKTYSVAVHFRTAKQSDVARVEQIVDGVLAAHPGLRRTGGKKVFELRPDIDWDKGKAVLWLLDELGLDQAGVVPIYIGDDATDRDAFAALRGKGISILVSDDVESAGADYRLSDPAEVQTFLNELLMGLDSRR